MCGVEPHDLLAQRQIDPAVHARWFRFVGVVAAANQGEVATFTDPTATAPVIL